MRPSPSANPPTLLRHAVERAQAEGGRASEEPEPRRSSPQVTPFGLAVAVTVAIGVGCAAVMVIG